MSVEFFRESISNSSAGLKHVSPEDTLCGPWSLSGNFKWI